MVTKKTLTILLTVFSSIIILDTLNFGHVIALFLLAGVIPGTNISLDADTMLIVFSAITGFTLSRLFIKLAAALLQRSHQASTGTILSAHS